MREASFVYCTGVPRGRPGNSGMVGAITCPPDRVPWGRPGNWPVLRAGHNTPRTAVPELDQGVSSQVATLEASNSPDVIGRKDSDPKQKIVDRSRLVGAFDDALRAAIPLFDQRLPTLG